MYKKDVPRQIIFEAPDRCGKDTQISLFRKYVWEKYGIAYNLSHYSFQKEIENYYEYSYKLYENLIRKMIFSISDYDIYNRSYIGEYVYAPLYRNYSGEYIFDLEMKNYIDASDHICLITLIANPELLISREDGFSFSNSIENKEKEIELFKKAHDLSIIRNKIMLDCTGLTPQQTHETIIDLLNI